MERKMFVPRHADLPIPISVGRLDHIILMAGPTLARTKRNIPWPTEAAEAISRSMPKTFRIEQSISCMTKSVAKWSHTGFGRVAVLMRLTVPTIRPVQATIHRRPLIVRHTLGAKQTVHGSSFNGGSIGGTQFRRRIAILLSLHRSVGALPILFVSRSLGCATLGRASGAQRGGIFVVYSRAREYHSGHHNLLG